MCILGLSSVLRQLISLYYPTSTKPEVDKLMNGDIDPREVNPNDFGLISKATGKLTDQKMYHLIQNRWKPTKDFKFPQPKEGQKTRKFVYDWLEKYPWLAYSKYLDGCFCIVCSLFANRIGKNSGKLTKLLSELLILLTSAANNFREHDENSSIHRFSMHTMLDFKDVIENKALLGQVFCCIYFSKSCIYV